MKKKQHPEEEKAKPSWTTKLKDFWYSSLCKGWLLLLTTTLILMLIFFVVNTPRRYDLTVGGISHVTISATRDVVDEVATEERREIAASQVEPTYRFQTGVKEEVMESLEDAFNELRGIQQYGLSLRTDESGRRTQSFSEDEIAYAIGLTDKLSLTRTQLTTLMRTSTEAFEDMVSTVTTVVENTMNLTIREGQVNQSIQTIQQNVGFRVDVSLNQNILPLVLRTCVQPNILIDVEATDEARKQAREAVEPVVYQQGQNIIREGDRINEAHIELLKSLGLLNNQTYDYSIYGGSVLAVLLGMCSLVMMIYLMKKEIMTSLRELIVLLLILILCVGLGALGEVMPSIYVVPVALGSLLATVLLGSKAGIILIVPLSLLLGSLTAGNNTTTFYNVVIIMSMTVADSVVCIWFMKGHPQRLRILAAGVLSGIISAVIIISIKLMTSSDSLDMLLASAWAMAGSTIGGALAIALQPALEYAFHLPTISRLQEITNPNQPLMRRLMIEAPGTYHHSIIVANLAEAAANKIHANAYLARAAAYYHDIGKLKRPQYFKENQMGDNPHEKTDPYVSAAILTSHPRDGQLMAQKERLPQEVQDIILQHHGVTPTMFFYHKALQLSNGSAVDINEFRYAGPKPQTKEAAIVMLADTIEAAVRSMKDPTPKGIDQFIERLVRGKLEDGQLSDSPLTLRDIDQICEAFSGILRGVYHERIEYPTVSHYATKQPPESGADEEKPT